MKLCIWQEECHWTLHIGSQAYSELLTRNEERQWTFKKTVNVQKFVRFDNLGFKVLSLTRLVDIAVVVIPSSQNL